MYVFYVCMCSCLCLCMCVCVCVYVFAYCIVICLCVFMSVCVCISYSRPSGLGEVLSGSIQESELGREAFLGRKRMKMKENNS